MDWLYGKMRIPSSRPGSQTALELFTKPRPNVSRLRPFGCLAYVHLQKDQRPALAPHASQCVLIGYPREYKGWLFYNPYTQKSFVSDSAVFRESVFPFRKTGLSGVATRQYRPILNGVMLFLRTLLPCQLPVAHLWVSSRRRRRLPLFRLFPLLFLLPLLLPWW